MSLPCFKKALLVVAPRAIQEDEESYDEWSQDSPFGIDLDCAEDIS
jgi:hypothetical protein